MGFLSRVLGGQANATVQKFNGNKDYLEAVCAAAALVAASDGDISDDEVETTGKIVRNNAVLRTAFNDREIETTIDTMLGRAKGGRSGRVGLMNEIGDIVEKDPSMGEAVYLMAVDVAESSGDISAQEQAVLSKIAERLRIDPRKYDI
jgi:tellurite resistance protein TerB